MIFLDAKAVAEAIEKAGMTFSQWYARHGTNEGTYAGGLTLTLNAEKKEGRQVNGSYR